MSDNRDTITCCLAKFKNHLPSTAFGDRFVGSRDVLTKVLFREQRLELILLCELRCFTKNVSVMSAT